MSARPVPWVNKIMQGIAFVIQQHAIDHPELWASVPAEVVVGTGASQIEAPRPLLVVTCDEVSDLLTQASGPHVDAEAAVSILGAISDPVAPEVAAHNLVADVRRALMSDPQLGGLLPNGYVEPAGYAATTDIDESTGDAVVVVRFKAFFEWSKDAP